MIIEDGLGLFIYHRIQRMKNLFRYRFLKRLSRRFRYLLRWREMWSWEYESCKHCGSCYRLTTGWIDSTWIQVNGGYGGCLCIDCFLTLAQKKRIVIDIKDIERTWVFDPKDLCGGGFYLIKPTGQH